MVAVYSRDTTYQQTSSDVFVATAYSRLVSVSPGSVAFGAAALGSAQTASVTVTNTGLDPVKMTSASVGAARFSISGSSCAGATPSAGQTCTITVQFAPTTAGSFTRSLTINDNATPAKQTVSLTGTGH